MESTTSDRTPDETVSWQSKRSALQCHRYMLENKIATDVCFNVGSPEDDAGEMILAHKYVLMSRSEVFEAMFCSGMAESRADCDHAIRIPDIEPETFHQMLQFMYCDATDATAETALPLLYAAEKYMLKGLIERCENILISGLTDSNVCSILEHCVKFDMPSVKSRCLAYIRENTSMVARRTRGFCGLSLNVLELILSQDYLQLKNETVLFKLCQIWAKYPMCETDCKTTSMSAEQFRKVIGSALFRVRLPTLTHVEFAELVGMSKLLTSDEKNDIYFFIATQRRATGLQFDSIQRHFLTSRKFVTRFQKVSSALMFYANRRAFRVDFEVTCDITLTAVGLYGASEPAMHNIRLHVIDGSDKELCRTETTMSSSGSVEDIEVLLEKPVAIEANKRYTVALDINGPDTYLGCKGTGSNKVCWVSGQESITVLFIPSKNFSDFDSTIVCGQIPTLYFW